MSRILIVDDNEPLLEMEAEWLRQNHYRVETALNGAIALRLLRTQRFDLVISDMIMPEIEGVELIRHLRESHRTTRILAVSGDGGGDASAYLMLARRFGADGTLLKPYSGEQLLSLVNVILGAQYASA